MKTLILLIVFVFSVRAEIVNIVIEMDDADLDPAEISAIKGKGACWEEVSHTQDGSREMIDVLIEDGTISGLLNCLGGYNPIVLGCWRQDGVQYGQYMDACNIQEGCKSTTIIGDPVYEFNMPRWLSLSPRVPIMDGMNIIGWKDETNVRQIHKFSGWEDRKFFIDGKWTIMSSKIDENIRLV